MLLNHHVPVTTFVNLFNFAHFFLFAIRCIAVLQIIKKKKEHDKTIELLWVMLISSFHLIATYTQILQMNFRTKSRVLDEIAKINWLRFQIFRKSRNLSHGGQKVPSLTLNVNNIFSH